MLLGSRAHQFLCMSYSSRCKLVVLRTQQLCCPDLTDVLKIHIISSLVSVDLDINSRVNGHKWLAEKF